MNIPKPDRSTYTPVDFQEWMAGERLVLAPKFQRRGVWTSPARSYFIDTLLRGMPVPPIYLRILQDDERTKVIREVIDGQQRISAVLDFINNKYAISGNLGGPHKGKRFSSLSEDEKEQITTYSFICEIMQGISDSEVLEIFARLNTYSVRLNNQELRNGKFFGPFKQSCYKLAYEHVEFWRNNKIFSETSIARMLEVELTSEILISQIDGLQDKKSSINDFYEKYDETYKQNSVMDRRFRHCIDISKEALENDLSSTEFRRPPLFYTLCNVIYHRIFGLPGIRIGRPRGKISPREIEDLRDAVITLSDMIKASRNEENVPKRFVPFVNACLRQTDNIRPRETRLKFLYAEAFQ